MTRARSELSAANRELQDTLQWPWAVVVGLLLGLGIGLANLALSLRRD
jgi:hypothetical protein